MSTLYSMFGRKWTMLDLINIYEGFKLSPYEKKRIERYFEIYKREQRGDSSRTCPTDETQG